MRFQRFGREKTPFYLVLGPTIHIFGYSNVVEFLSYLTSMPKYVLCHIWLCQNCGCPKFVLVGKRSSLNHVLVSPVFYAEILPLQRDCKLKLNVNICSSTTAHILITKD
jgi:hypothetical protein